MIFYGYVQNNKIIGCGQVPCNNDDIDNIEINKDMYNSIIDNDNRYIYSDGNIIVNPNYESEQEEKRRVQFHLDFFNTTIGYIRRKVSMKTGETKDFLTDLLPVISMAVNSGQQVNVITYKEPDFTQEEVDWEELQTVKVATPQFIQECFNQVSTDFTGI